MNYSKYNCIATFLALLSFAFEIAVPNLRKELSFFVFFFNRFLFTIPRLRLQTNTFSTFSCFTSIISLKLVNELDSVYFERLRRWTAYPQSVITIR